MLGISELLVIANWTGWRRWSVRLICVSAVAMLGVLRVATDAEFAFASLALFPVLIVSWVDGQRNGILLAMFAAVIWEVPLYLGMHLIDHYWIPVANTATRLVVYGVVAILAAKLRVQYELTHAHAMLDGLTELPNRRAFVQTGEIEATRARRYGHSLAVLFIDLDDFKLLNDSKGHDAGDLALVAAAGAIRSSVRKSDAIARLGGDEFAVLLPEADMAETRQVVEKLQHAINGALTDYPPVRCSLGAAWFEVAHPKFASMLAQADKLMYEVKVAGKSGVRIQSVKVASNAALAGMAVPDSQLPSEG